MQSEDDIGKGVVRIRSWAEFKRLVESFKPKAIVYNIEQNGLSPKRELTNLRFILPTGSAYYVFLDFAEGERLKETGIQLRRTIRGPLFGGGRCCNLS